MTGSLLSLPARIRRAEALLPLQAEDFRTGATTADAFRAQRVPQGLYEQRTPGTFMLRLRLPGGLLTATQAAGLARQAQAHGCTRLHLTTREGIQAHDLSLAAAVALQQGLPALGLSARGTGGNTVRNVTGDPLAGVAADEAFDVRPWVLATTGALLEREDSEGLPRKFKVVFAGSEADRPGAGVADLGFLARTREGLPGFVVLAGGGLGGRPLTALTVLPWVPAAEAPRIAVALLRLFATHGDRANKATARLRHVRLRRGDDAFRDLCLGAIAAQAPVHVPPQPALPPLAGAVEAPVPAHLAGIDGILAQRQAGRHAVRLAPPLGDLRPEALAAIATAAARWADPVLRAGLDQDLWLTGVAGTDLDALLRFLEHHDLGLPGERRSHIPACAGADTCKLGLLRSRACASAIADRLAREDLRVQGLRVSGCPNSCGRHLVAGIGLQGRVRKVNGRLLPSYEVLTGGRHGVEARLATRVGTIPARRAPDLLLHVARGGDLEVGVARLSALPEEIPESWFRDWGAAEPFSLAGLSAGECAAG